jgi:hypothetical protein
LTDPEILKERRLEERGRRTIFSRRGSLLLSLRPRTREAKSLILGTLLEYLLKQILTVSVQFIGRWFEKRFDSGSVPCQTWCRRTSGRQIVWYYGNFRLTLEQPPNRTKFHWLDEKHLLNRDVEAQRGEPTHSLDTSP